MVKLHQAEPVQFHARKGQALIWAANLLHGGSKQLEPARSRWSLVTHYYFDDCAYYTPMFSDPVYGRTFFREPFDISTGKRMRSNYLGREIPAETIRRQRASKSLEECLAHFDAAAYLQANPDVRASGIDPRQHFVQYGYSEGRPLGPARY
jgi:S-adenosylmethionine synthetase